MLQAWIDTLIHWDIFRANHSILFLLNAAGMDRHVDPLGHIQSLPAALRRKSIEWLALNVSQWNNVSIHACSIKE
jgi:hypothetical protein